MDPQSPSFLRLPGVDTPLAGGLRPGAAGANDREKVAQLAREFEAFFVHQMIRQMRESMLEDESNDGLGAGTMTSTLDVELSRQLANQGGFGLAKVLQEAIERQATGTKPSSDVPAAGVAPAVSTIAYRAATLPGVTPAEPHETEPSLPLPLTARISSAYGWRSDPFDGTARFHAGVDIAAAYGRAVPAADGGRVVFAGTQGGYGNTVVIEHAGGVRTRYAHLASIDVAAGSGVSAGQTIGRVGSSGRSTGPHLHFEVLQDGQPVNPEVVATRFAGRLKLGGVVADSPISQPSMSGVAVGVDDEDSGQ